MIYYQKMQQSVKFVWLLHMQFLNGCVRVEEGTAMMMAYTDHRGFSVAKFCSPLLGL